MMDKIITRIWHGKVKKEKAEAYINYIENTGIKNYREIEGNISAKILHRFEDDVCHILTVTEWDSYHSIKKFAGDDFHKARYYDEDKEYLLEFEEHVTHYKTNIYDHSN